MSTVLENSETDMALEALSDEQLRAAAQLPDKVMSIMESILAALEEGRNPAPILSTMEQLVRCVPISTEMLTTLLTVIEYGLRACLLMESLTDLTSLLTTLFKTTYSQLKTAVRLLENVTDVSLLDNVAIGLIKVAQIAITMDPSVLALCWRVLGSLIPKLTDSGPVLHALCWTVDTKFRECCETDPRQVKLVTFLSNLLSKCTQEAADMTDEVLSCVLSSLSAGHCQEQALYMMETMLLTMVHSMVFLELLLTSPFKGEHCLGRLLCLCGVIPLLPNMEGSLSDYCLEAMDCRLVTAILYTLRQNYVSLQLPVRLKRVMTVDKPSRMMTLQEHVTIHLSLLCSVVPLSHLAIIERSLFRGVLSPLLHVSLVCADAWIFHVQRCPQTTLIAYCHILCTLLQELNSAVLTSLLYRVLCLVPPIQTVPPCVLTPVLLSAPEPPTSVHLTHTHCKDLPGLVLSTSLVDSNKELLTEHLLTRLEETANWPALGRLLCKLPLTHAQFNKVLAVSLDHWSEMTALTLCALLTQFGYKFAQHSFKLAPCFERLISSNSWLVHHVSLEAFRVLAKVHGDTAFMEGCVPKGHTTALLEFLHERPCGDSKHLELALRQQWLVLKSVSQSWT